MAVNKAVARREPAIVNGGKGFRRFWKGRRFSVAEYILQRVQLPVRLSYSRWPICHEDFVSVPLGDFPSITGAQDRPLIERGCCVPEQGSPQTMRNITTGRHVPLWTGAFFGYAVWNFPLGTTGQR